MRLQITAYFMELAPPRPEEAIQLVDKVAGIEWLIQKYEVDGASAIKLDLSLDNPIIVVPRNSVSKELVFQLFSLIFLLSFFPFFCYSPSRLDCGFILV